MIMKTLVKRLASVGLLSLVLSAPLQKIQAQDFNSNWRFTLSDSAKYAFQNYESKSWRKVNLPHDWSVEHPFDSIKGEGCTAYLLGGIGWYSKEFKTPVKKNQKCYLIFDGVYNNSTYYINGRELGTHPYGYSPFFFDVSNYLKPNQEVNRLAIRVDHSRFADSRWYTGSGMYRGVKLLVTDKLHIPVWGTFITTPKVSKKKASIALSVSLQNDYQDKKSGVVKTLIYNPENIIVAQVSTPFNISASGSKDLKQELTVDSPLLWDVDSPKLYRAETSVIASGKKLSTKTTTFGIRSIRFDAQKGFFLNGKNRKIKGVCLHHDGGLIGTAFYREVWERRLRKLKEMGCNAIRTSHNPAADDFLSLCDEMGFLVQEEFFDEWDNPKDKRLNMQERSIDYITRGHAVHFQEWAERDLKNTMLRSRNHPSIFQWSIGNEIEWTYKGCREATGFFGADANGGYFWNQPPYSHDKIKKLWKEQPKRTYDIGKTAYKLACWTKEMDTTRPVIANCILPSVSYESGYIDALDIAGFSYRRVMYDYAKKNYPNKPVMGTENLGQWHEWKAVLERDFVSGIFIWTGIDYLGERGGKRKQWPNKTTASGLLDLAGFEKPSYYMMKSLWNETPSIAIYSQKAQKSAYKVENHNIVDKKHGAWKKRLWVWDDVNSHWNYQKGDSVIVELYSNCDIIELFQNGKSLGKKSLADFPDHIYKWLVMYEPGKLTAKGYNKRAEVVQSIKTAGKVHAIRLTSDKTSLKANHKDLVHVVAQLVDKNGNEISDRDCLLNFDLKGAYRLLGVDNGDTGNVTPFQSQQIKTYKGRCLLIFQSTDDSSQVEVSASSKEIKSNQLTINIK